jgi:hypothetical protein
MSARKLSNVSRVEQSSLNSDLLASFTAFTGGTMKMTQEQLVKFAQDCELIEEKKLPETEVNLMFSKVKLGKKTEIDFERFQECLRMMAIAKLIPYHQLITDSIRDVSIQQEAKAPTSMVGGGRPGTIEEYANRLRANIRFLQLQDFVSPDGQDQGRKRLAIQEKVNVEELTTLARQILEDSGQYLGGYSLFWFVPQSSPFHRLLELKNVTQNALTVLDQRVLGALEKAKVRLAAKRLLPLHVAHHSPIISSSLLCTTDCSCHHQGPTFI